MLILLRMEGSLSSGQRMCSEVLKGNVLSDVVSVTRKSCAMNSMMLGVWKIGNM